MEYTYDEKVLTINLPARIDSGSAPDAEREIFALIDENKPESVILDAADTEYISSAGLRVVLKLKKTVPDLKIINASSEVYEIFSMTGFSEIIDIKKAFREISVDGCEIIGKGGHGTVYRLDRDTILKLYSEKEPLSNIEREIEYARNAFVAGIPTAIPFDVVKCGNRYGSVFELINADTFANALKKNPDKYDEYSKKYTELVNTLHTIEADTSRFSCIKEIYNNRSDDMSKFLTPDEIGLLHDIINSVPDRNTFVHGDIHTKNVMMQEGELLFIDMADITYGHPIFDYMGMILTHVIAGRENPARAREILDLDYDTGVRLWNDFLKARFGALGDEGMKQINGLIMAFGMLKFTVSSAVNKNQAEEFTRMLVGLSRERFFPNAKNLIGAVKF